MRFSVACNFDRELIKQIKKYPVEEMYGKLPEDFIGGGRSTYMLPTIKKKDFEEFTDFVQRNNITFNYLLNAPCFNNQEFTKNGQKKINRILDWLQDININSVTVSNPFLLQIIKKRYPRMHVRISVFACVDSPLKVSRWEELGADCITLDSILVNRDFDLLRKIRQYSKIDLQIMVNNSCLLSCPMCHYHNTVLGHSSQSKHKNKGFVTDVCILRCSYIKLKSPVNYLQCEWIRPEDIHFYEEMGYDNFKIVERSSPTEILVRRVKSYAERHYDGNLLDIVQPYGYKIKDKHIEENKKQLFSLIKFLLNPGLVNPRKILKIKELAEKRGLISTGSNNNPVYIDNRNLDGFINGFIKNSCRCKSCDECQYCHRFAEKAIQIDSGFREECLQLYEEVFDIIYSGDLWDQKRRKSQTANNDSTRRKEPI